MSIKRNLPFSLLPVCFAAIIISACSNTTITSSYLDPDIDTRDLDGVLVVAVTRSRSGRTDFEDAFTRALENQGIRAVASHTRITLVKPTAEDVIAAAEAANLDTILVTRYIGKESQEVYHPGTVYYGIAPGYGAGYYRGFSGYYGHAYEIAYEQPVWSANVTYTLLSDLYTTKTKEHLWQAGADIVKAGGDKRLRNDAIRSLMGNLKEQGLL